MDYFNFLPEEITLNILTRVPTESVLDCKLVSTNWRSVVHHPSFSKMHFHRHNDSTDDDSGKLCFIASTHNEINQIFHYFEYDDESSTNPIQKIKRINLVSPSKEVSSVDSCNGLICLSGFCHPFVWICNPITREYVILPELKREFHKPISFGYVSSTNEYKVVETHLRRRATVDFGSEGWPSIEVHIYTVGSGTGWRNVGNFNFGSTAYNLDRAGMFANEALYWLDDEFKRIITFDLAKEKFCEDLWLPPFPPLGCCVTRIGVLDGFLYFATSIILYDRNDGFYDIWLLKKKENNQDKEQNDCQSFGWTKEFRFENLHLLAVTKSDRVFTYEYNYLNIFDTKTSTSKSLVKFKESFLQVSPHKNTLVSLKELGEEETKVMESVEIVETKSHEQLQEDAEPDYIYL